MPPDLYTMEQKYIQKIGEKLGFTLNQVANINELHSGGSTIPFIARYRKEATGNMDEVQINDVIEQISYFTELDKRKETVIKTIEGLGKLTPELRARITDSYDATELEDIYLPYKPKRKTRAVAAIEKGLEPLAKRLFDQEGACVPEEEAEKFLTDAVAEVKDALQGARDIMAEWIAENEQARNKVRNLFRDGAVLYARVPGSKKEEPEAQKYRDYFEFQEPLQKCPSHRVLAIRRGEKEGFLLMDITIDRMAAVDELDRFFIKASNPAAAEVKKAVEDSYDRLLKPSIENEFRLISKNAADEEAIKVFAENLRQLLLAAPLGAKRILALDPGFRTGCKLVCLDAQGNFLYNSTIYTLSAHQTEEAIQELKFVVNKYEIEAIGVGNGTAGRETEQLVRGIDFGRHISVFQVNESGASIYSASEVAREEFPDQDVTVRGAISIGRRLLDPLSELVKIDAKSIGVGQYQHDVNQTRLKDSLDKVVESCVNHVGVNLNTASKHLLMYVSGLSATLAKNIVEYRMANGRFGTREELKKVSLMGPKTFEQCAGFLRLPGGNNPLDNSAVHPETYPIVERMAKDMNCTLEELIQQPELRKGINRKQYVTETAGEFTIADILKELEKPGRDPRSQVEEFRFDDTIKSIEDLKPGMRVPGLVTNITNFGAFVDIGVKQDGLVHISQLSNTYVSDPNTVVKLQQKVMVTVTEVDVARKRIALSMKEGTNREAGKAKAPALGKPGHTSKKTESLNPFQAKLMELKRKFD